VDGSLGAGSVGAVGEFKRYIAYAAILVIALAAIVFVTHYAALATLLPSDLTFHRFVFSPGLGADYGAGHPSSPITTVIIDPDADDGELRVEQFEPSRQVRPLTRQAIEETRKDEVIRQRSGQK